MRLSGCSSPTCLRWQPASRVVSRGEGADGGGVVAVVADAHLDVGVAALLRDGPAQGDDGAPPPVRGDLDFRPVNLVFAYEGWFAVGFLAPCFDEGFFGRPPAGKMFHPAGSGWFGGGDPQL